MIYPKIYDLPEGGWEGWHTDDKGEEHDAEEDGHEERQHGAGALTLPRHGHVGGGGTGIVAHTAAVLVLLQINNIIFHFNSIIILQYKVMKYIIKTGTSVKKAFNLMSPMGVVFCEF